MNTNNDATSKRALEEEARRAYTSVKQDIDLIEFATSRLGWQVDKTKSSKKDIVLKHPKHGKIVAPSSPKQQTGQWVFSWIDKQGGGTLIDLLLEDGWQWKEIKELAKTQQHIPVSQTSPQQQPPTPQPTTKHPQEAEKLALHKFNAVKNIPDTTYLTHRGIKSETYAPFRQVHADKTQAVFKLYRDFDQQGNGKVCSTINYYIDKKGDSQKYFQKDLSRGVAVLKTAEEPKTIIVTESPIDALSHRQLQLNKAAKTNDTTLKETIDKTMYVATCGNISANILSDLRQIFEMAHKKSQHIVLAFDNDAPGKKMTEQLRHVLGEKVHSYAIATPLVGKDWNDTLTQKAGKKQETAVGQEVPTIPQQAIAQEAPTTPKQAVAQEAPTSPKQTISSPSSTHHLGIDEKVFQDLQGCQVEGNTFTAYLYDNAASEGEPRGAYKISADEYGIETQHQDHGLSMLKTSKGVQNIVVTEDPLEALMHRQALWKKLQESLATYSAFNKEVHLKLADYQGSVGHKAQQLWQGFKENYQKYLALGQEAYQKFKDSFSEKAYQEWRDICEKQHLLQSKVVLS